MSVQVNNISKLYGQQRAVDQVTFEAKKGEVLGFLGPNGAGKTTTMKILTGFISPTTGSASVCGFDIETDILSVRKRIGYLPEHNPLYKDMYVQEYLMFVAGLYKISHKKDKVASIIERTGLGLEQHKYIGALSKGFRQRVGLAQAIIHDPEVLILDEPTSGLDPNQLAEIRQLIKSLGKEKTVIFSTHIMQEVQALCDRVLIINHGKIVADDPIGRLSSRITGESVVTVEWKERISSKVLKAIPGLSRVEKVSDKVFRLFAPLEIDLREEIFKFAAAKELPLLSMQKEIVSVEDVFQKLTQKPKDDQE